MENIPPFTGFIVLAGVLLSITLRLRFNTHSIRIVTSTLLIGLMLISAGKIFSQMSRLHEHDLYHYVIGGKYFHDLGYNGIYAATALALEESGVPVEGTLIRVLSHRTETRDDNWRLHGTAIKENMEHWPTFQADILFFNERFTEVGVHWQDIFIDHGFNPSPMWVFYAAPLLHFFPLADIYPWLSMIDMLFLLLCAVLLAMLAPPAWRLPVVAVYGSVLAFYPTGVLDPFIWIGGAYFRFSWFAFLVTGFFFLVKQKYAAAGFFLALAGFERIFPFAFAGAVFLVLTVAMLRAGMPRQRAQWLKAPLIRFGAGFLICATLCVTLLFALYPAKYLHDFARNIHMHASLFDGTRIGYQKAVVSSKYTYTYRQWFLDRDDVNQESVSEGRYTQAYNHALQQHYQQNIVGKMLLIILAALAFIAGLFYMPGVVGMLFIGTIVIYLFALINHYYYAYFSLYSALLLIYMVNSEEPGKNIRHWIYLLLFFMVISLLATLESRNPGLQSILISGIMIFFIPSVAGAYLFQPRRQWLALTLITACFGVIVLLNHHPVDPRLLPAPGSSTVIEVPGETAARALPMFSPLMRTYLDENAAIIHETGVIIPHDGEMTVKVPLARVPTQAMTLWLRSDFNYPVVLTVAVNGQVAAEHRIRKLGGMFGYEKFSLPPAYWQPGDNTVLLKVREGKALAMFHLWLTRDAAR